MPRTGTNHLTLLFTGVAPGRIVDCVDKTSRLSVSVDATRELSPLFLQFPRSFRTIPRSQIRQTLSGRLFVEVTLPFPNTRALRPGPCSLSVLGCLLVEFVEEATTSDRFDGFPGRRAVDIGSDEFCHRIRNLPWLFRVHPFCLSNVRTARYKRSRGKRFQFMGYEIDDKP